jgi:hypothetical protein
MNIQETLNNLKTIGNEVIELQRKAKEARKAALEPFLEALAASGEVSIITVRGSTPSFNDGEPCEHGADFWVNVKQHAADEIDMNDDLEELFEELQDYRVYNRETRQYDEIPGAIDTNRALCAAKGHVYDTPSKEIMDAISAVIFDSIEEDYGTNYFVTFTLEDGKFKRYEGEYDCGY